MKVFEHWSGHTYIVYRTPVRSSGLGKIEIYTTLKDLDLNIEIKEAMAASIIYFTIDFENDIEALMFKMRWLN